MFIIRLKTASFDSPGTFRVRTPFLLQCPHQPCLSDNSAQPENVTQCGPILIVCPAKLIVDCEVIVITVFSTIPAPVSILTIFLSLYDDDLT
jgi:hypothetical protein